MKLPRGSYPMARCRRGGLPDLVELMKTNLRKALAHYS